MQKNHGYRYYAWELKDGKLKFFDHPVNLPREKKYEGKYLIQTDQTDMTAEDGVAYYKELNRSGAWIPFAQGPAGNATHLASQSAPG